MLHTERCIEVIRCSIEWCAIDVVDPGSPWALVQGARNSRGGQELALALCDCDLEGREGLFRRRERAAERGRLH